MSLKGLGIQMGYPVVQELPYDPNFVLTKEQIEEIKTYNLVHDLGILDLVLLQFLGKGKCSIGNLGTVQLREFVTKTYKIPAMSMDAPKIASEILLDSFCKKTTRDKKEVRNLRFSFETIYFKDLFQDLEIDFTLPVLKDVYKEWCNSVNSFSKEFVIEANHPIKISIGNGGIK